MQCENCGTANESDGNFCRECGQKLGQTAAESLGADQHVRIGELIYAAYKHKETGRIEDALLACQGALALNDASASAHSLLGSLYEIRGDVASAICEYEKAAELNPGSTADRQKIEDIKSGRTVPPLLESSAAGRLQSLMPHAPYAAAAAVVIIVLALALTLGRSPVIKSIGGSGEQPTGGPSIVPQTTPPIRPYLQPGYRQFGTANQQPSAGEGQLGVPAQGSQSSPRQADSGLSGVSGIATPGASASGIPVPSGPRPGNRAPAGQPPTPIAPPVIVPVIEPSERPVQTSVHSAPTPPAEAIPASRPAEDPEQMGVQFQHEGRYQEAIAAYRQALTRTSDTGRIHQQIARCYQHLGDHDKAVETYNRAIKSYRDQLAAGRDETEVQRNIRSCEAGIKVSQSEGR